MEKKYIKPELQVIQVELHNHLMDISINRTELENNSSVGLVKGGTDWDIFGEYSDEEEE